MASSGIYNRNGTWYYRGYKTRFSLKTRNKKIAQKLKDEFDLQFALDKINGGVIRTNKRVTFSEAIAEYLAYKRKNFKPRTYETDKQRLSWFLNFTGDLQLSKITEQTIVDYISERIDEVQWNTIRITLNCLRAFVNWCKKSKKYISNTPFENFKIKKWEEKIYYLTMQEAIALKNYEDKNRPWLNVVYNLALSTGWRVGEIASLRWDNIRNDAIYVEGKTGIRSFPCWSQVLETINKMPRKSEFVFPSARNEYGHILADTITGISKKVFRKLNFPEHYCFNTLRHTFASHSHLNGVKIEVISKLLGHKNLNTTMIYTHITAHEISESARPRYSENQIMRRLADDAKEFLPEGSMIQMPNLYMDE